MDRRLCRRSSPPESSRIDRRSLRLRWCSSFHFQCVGCGVVAGEHGDCRGQLGARQRDNGSVIEHPSEAQRILKLPKHSLAISILCIGHSKKKPRRREKWSHRIIVCKDAYKDVDKEDVEEYWKRFIMSDIKRSGRKLPVNELEELIKERKQTSYGSAYSNHYTVQFVKNTNRKLSAFLKKQGLL